MELISARPFSGDRLKRLTAFLSECGLDYDEGIDYTVCAVEEDAVIASASLDGATIKCVAVSPAHQGEDLTAVLLTDIFSESARRGNSHLMLYTKPKNRLMFAQFGFYPVVETRDVLMLENKRHGLDDFLSVARDENARGRIGCVIANCDPFTLGHRYLIETAARECDFVYVFVLSEDRGMLSADERIELVRRGTRDLTNARVRPSGPYMISSATFPTYFLRDKASAEGIRCDVDIRLFGERIAPALGIGRRYVGTEPFDPVTGRYNALLECHLREYGIELREIGRLSASGTAISARTVRDCMRRHDYAGLRAIVPITTYEYLLRRGEK